MKATEKRNRLLEWEVSTPFRMSKQIGFSASHSIFDDRLYQNLYCRFSPPTGDDVFVRFLVGPSSFSASFSNILSPRKTTSGNVIEQNGVNLGTIQISGVLIETANCREASITVENLINLSSAPRTKSGNNPLYTTSIVFEGVEYFGVFQNYSYQASAHAPYLVSFSLGFSVTEYQIIEDVERTEKMIWAEVHGTESLLPDQEDEVEKVLNGAFTPSEISKTDSDSLIEDDTAADFVEDNTVIDNGLYNYIIDRGDDNSSNCTIYAVLESSFFRETTGYSSCVPSSIASFSAHVGDQFFGVSASSVESLQKMSSRTGKIETLRYSPRTDSSTTTHINNLVFIDGGSADIVLMKGSGTDYEHWLRGMGSDESKIYFLVDSNKCSKKSQGQTPHV